MAMEATKSMNELDALEQTTIVEETFDAILREAQNDERSCNHTVIYIAVFKRILELHRADAFGHTFDNHKSTFSKMEIRDVRGLTHLFISNEFILPWRHLSESERYNQRKKTLMNQAICIMEWN